MQNQASVIDMTAITESGLGFLTTPANAFENTFEHLASAILANEMQIKTLRETVQQQRADLIEQMVTTMQQLNITVKDIQAALNEPETASEPEVKTRRTRAPRGSRKIEDPAISPEQVAVESVAGQAIALTTAQEDAKAETQPAGSEAGAATAAPQEGLSEEGFQAVVEAIESAAPAADNPAVDNGEEEGVSLCDAIAFGASWAGKGPERDDQLTQQ